MLQTIMLGFGTQHTDRIDSPMADANQALELSRYPKRKRVEISYAPPKDSEDDWNSEDDYDSQPKKKVKTTTKKLPKHKIFPFL